MSYEIRRPERWFVKDLQLIDRRFNVKWIPKINRWMVTFNGESSHLVCEMVDGATGIVKKIGRYIPLDQRTLRKVRVDHYLTVNPKALDHWLDDDPLALMAYVARGISGVKDYLSGL